MFLQTAFQALNKILFQPQKVFCVEEVDMDSPAYAQQDPHLRINDDEEGSELPPYLRNRFPQRPPLFDSLLNNIRAITKKVEHIKGFKFEVSGALSNNFHLTHSWAIPNGGSAQPSQKMNPMKPPQSACYTLGAQFLGGTLRTPLDQPSFIMTGRMDSTGKLEAAFIKKINEMFNFRISAFYLNSDPLNSQMHLDVDITGDDYVHTVKWGTGLLSFNMMQTIGSRLILGYEVMSLYERKMISMSYACKLALSKRSSIISQYIGPAEQFILGYNHKILPKAQFVSEFAYSQQNGDTTAILGFRQKFQTSEVIATFNSKWKLSTILSISGMAYQLKLCAIADYLKDNYKFGYGIQMGQIG